MTTSGTEAPAAGPLPEAEDPRTAFRVDTVPRSIPEALRGYVVRVRGGDPGGLPAVLGLLVLGVIFAVTTPRFLTAVNVGNLMSQASFIALIGLGLVFVLILGEIDLSAGTAGGVCAGFAAQALASGNLSKAVGGGVFTGLLVGMLVCLGLAAWNRLWPAAAVIALGLLCMVTGFEENHVWVAFFFALSLGVSIGVLNGVLVTLLGIPSFIVTLALFLAWEGVTLFAVNSQSISTNKYGVWFGLTHYNMAPWAGWVLFVVIVGGYTVVTIFRARARAAASLSHDVLGLVLLRAGVLAVAGAYLVWWLNQDRNPNVGKPIVGVPWAASIPLIFMVLFTILLTRTTWGRHLYAIGGNIEAARRAGVPVNRVKIGAFTLCSGMAAIGGLFLADFTGGAQPGLGQGDILLFSVAAAVIGGTSLFGGRGKARDAIVGALVIATIPNGIQLHPNLPIQVVEIITGAVLLVAASVDAISRRRSTAR